ncbi:DUF1972 domain-containing protein [Vibrio cyclitrophicus]
MKKVVVVGIVGIPACYGGFESLVENLTSYTSSDVSYTVFCSSGSYKNRKVEHNGAKLIYLPLKANGAQSIFYDIISLVRTLFIRPDIVLVLGVSGCLFLPLFKAISRSKVVTNIDGLEWKREKWGLFTRKFLKWSESLAVRYSDVVITDNQAISDYVQQEYTITSKTIAYGGDHSLRNINLEPSSDSSNFALGLCRIEPENNVEMILEAFSKTNRKLKFVGNWNNSDFGKRLFSKYSEFNNIELLNPIYDLDKLFVLRNQCRLYLHGHSAGGTNPSLVEMMHFGVPILAFDCNFNRYSTGNHGHYFKSSEELIKLMDTCSESSLIDNSIAMKKLANERYVWKQITIDYEDTYASHSD